MLLLHIDVYQTTPIILDMLDYYVTMHFPPSPVVEGTSALMRNETD